MVLDVVFCVAGLVCVCCVVFGVVCLCCFQMFVVLWLSLAVMFFQRNRDETVLGLSQPFGGSLSCFLVCCVRVCLAESCLGSRVEAV